MSKQESVGLEAKELVANDHYQWSGLHPNVTCAWFLQLCCEFRDAQIKIKNLKQKMIDIVNEIEDPGDWEVEHVIVIVQNLAEEGIEL